MLAILITLDCLRADHVGGPLGLTPRLDALGHEWTTFTQAFAQSQNTLSSHLSMLTSNYLFQHGVYSNYAAKELPAHALPKRLAERGWDCRAFTSVDFLALLLGNQIGQADSRFPAAADRSLPARLRRRLQGRRATAKQTLARGLRWLASPRRKEDAFLWLHLFDAHMVYEAPRAILKRFVSHQQAGTSVREQLKEKGWFSPDFPEYGRHVPLNQFPLRYRAAVAYLDACLGAFFDGMKSSGLWQDALVMVTADHGECLLGDHGVYCAHKKLFDTTVHVPLLVRFPGGAHAGRRVDALVQHVDLAPTVADLAGFAEPLYEGRSLKPVASGEDAGHETAFAEHVDNFMRAVRDRDWIYVERVPGSENKWGLAMEEGSLFRRDASPAPAADQAQAARLKEVLGRTLAARGAASDSWGQSLGPDAEISQRLKELGYM